MSEKNNYIFTIEMKVRDYECDLQGVVNNANYQHYFEHARHEFLESLGDNFQKMHEEGIDAMVSRIEIDYKSPLKSGDKFVVGINLQKEGVRLIFHEEVIRLKDGKVCAKGRVHTVVVKNGRLTRGEYVDELIKGVPFIL